MLTRSAQVARLFRAFVRWAFPERSLPAVLPSVILRQGPEERMLSACLPEVTLAYHEEDRWPSGDRIVRLHTFHRITARHGLSEEPTLPHSEVLALRDEQQRVPQEGTGLAASDRLSLRSSGSGTWVTARPGFLGALRDAAACTAREAGSYALDHILLRGSVGQIVATDGVQLLSQSGFCFPWTEDLLVSRCGLALAARLLLDRPVTMRRTREHVVLRAGSWEVALRADSSRRFPSVERLLQRPLAATRWRLAPVAASLLARALRAPGSGSRTRLVILDLARPATVWMQRPGGQWYLWVAHRSRVTGTYSCLTTGADYLTRALNLGFRAFQFTTSAQPIWACDRSRTLIWMPCTLDRGRTI